jgi:hypothetical protein
MVKFYGYCLKPEAISAADVYQRSAVLRVASWGRPNAHPQFATAGRC